MAGVMGIPIGTFGPGGADFTPYMQIMQQRQRQQEQLRQEALARAELAQQKETSFLNQEAQRLIQERQERLTRDQMAQSENRWRTDSDWQRQQATEQSQFERQQAEQRRADLEAERARQQQNADREFGQRDREFAAKQSILQDAQQRDQAQQQDVTNRTQVRGRARAIIAERVQQIQQATSEVGGLLGSLGGRAQGGMTPDALRDLMLAETQDAELTPEDRQEVQAAIQEWYQSALKTEDNEFAREFNKDKLSEQQAQRQGRERQGAADAEQRASAQRSETERKAAADRERAQAQRLALLDRKMARVEKRREEVFGTLEFQRGQQGSEEQVKRLEGELARLDAELAKLEAEEERIIMAGASAPAAPADSAWGDTLSE